MLSWRLLGCRREQTDWLSSGQEPDRRRSWTFQHLCPVLLAASATGTAWAQDQLPDAPAPHDDSAAIAPASVAPTTPDFATITDPPAAQETFPPEPRPLRGLVAPGLEPNYVPLPRACIAHACSESEPALICCQPTDDIFANYLRQNAVHIYTPRELGKIAIHAVIDPFNLLTIGGTSAITIMSDSRTFYGPGVKGWAKLSGITLTQDMTGEFVGTFLIPSIDHQDPHYHRMPNASLVRRIAHCAYQPFWTTSDTGKGMINYSTIVGSMIDEAVDVSYVPYQKEGWGPGAERIAVGWASAPIGNYVTEFLPDVASHINLKIVFIQRIINRVALEDGGS
jgi:hypothetical protein